MSSTEPSILSKATHHDSGKPFFGIHASQIMDILRQWKTSTPRFSITTKTLCDKCELILIDVLNKTFPSPRWITLKYRTTLFARVCQHHATFEALQLSSEGCELCSKLYSYAVEQSLGFVVPVWAEWGHGGQPSRVAFIKPSALGESNLKYRLKRAKLHPQLFSCDQFSRPKPQSRFTPWKQTGYSKTAFGLPIGRRLAPEPCTGESLDIVKSWMVDCAQNHPACKHYAPGKLPRRVIDVGSEVRNPTLHIADGEREPYLTLSHCWGGKLSSSLRKNNQELFQKGFHLSTLPKTFQDAIIVTRRLGVKYLWIDALCIIQDDLSDLNTETAAMAEIYEGALLNICPIGSPNSETGFLFPRTNGSVHFDAEDTMGHKQRLFLQVFEGGLDQKLDVDGILQQRGWTLQERVLSRANLCFPAPASGKGMLWECGFLRLSETSSKSWASEPRLKGIGLRSHLVHGERLHHLFPPIGDNAPQKSVIQWYRLVIEFSHRRLSFPKDKLLAISGLAASLGHEIKGRYVDGLWSNDMHRGLLWKIDYQGDQRDNEVLNRAPSWSWASCEGVISFPHVQYTMAPLPTRSHVDFGLDLNIIRMVEPSSIGSSYWSIEANGVIKPAMLQWEKTTMQLCLAINNENRDYMAEFSRSSIEECCWLDRPLISPLPKECFMMYICTIRRRRYVLFLELAEDVFTEQPVYRRIGIGYGEAGYVEASTIAAMQRTSFMLL